MALYDAGEMRIVDGLAPSMAPSRYGERRAVRWPMLLGIVGAHVLLAFTLDLAGMLPARRAPSELKLIQLSPEAAPPPPVVKAELPQQVLPEQPVPAALLEPVAPSFDAPPPVIAAPAVVITAPQAQPPPPAAVLAGPLRISDLDAKAITVVPPKYPIESRRRREQGTVVLAVTLAADGSVEAVSVARSSGFDRLDKAALDAVRRWRWSPTLRDGAPVSVRGTVDIPFVLQG